VNEQPETVTMHGHNWDVIHRYTRAQGIEDGMLVDVTDQAREVHYKLPTAVSRSIWDLYIDQRPPGSAWARLHHLLLTAKAAVLANAERAIVFTDRLTFSCRFPMEGADSVDGWVNVDNLVFHVGGDDNGEAVVTIMLPEDD
jgi:hypothetical protein